MLWHSVLDRNKCEIEARAEGRLQACLDFATCHEASNSFRVALLKWYKIKSIVPFAFSRSDCLLEQQESGGC